MEKTKKRKSFVIMTRGDFEKLERALDKLKDEVLMARQLVQNVSNASEKDPFRKAHLYLAEGAINNACGWTEGIEEFLDGKSGKGS